MIAGGARSMNPSWVTQFDHEMVAQLSQVAEALL